MSDPHPSLQIDTDWKKQAQEEKRKLAEQQKQKEAAPTTSAQPATPGGATPTRPARELPAATFGTIVQGIVTQTLYHLGDLSMRGGEGTVNLDLAKHHIDSLGVLEEKTKANLSADEQQMLDAALYEARMRYVNVASQYIT